MLRVVMTNIPNTAILSPSKKDYLRRVWNIDQAGHTHMLGRILQRGDWIIIYTECDSGFPDLYDALVNHIYFSGNSKEEICQPTTKPNLNKEEKEMKFKVNHKSIEEKQSEARGNIKSICNDLANDPLIVGNECQYSAEILSKLEIAVRGIKKNLEYLQYISKLTGASSIEMDESEFAQFNSDLSDY